MKYRPPWFSEIICPSQNTSSLFKFHFIYCNHFCAQKQFLNFLKGDVFFILIRLCRLHNVYILKAYTIESGDTIVNAPEHLQSAKVLLCHMGRRCSSRYAHIFFGGFPFAQNHLRCFPAQLLRMLQHTLRLSPHLFSGAHQHERLWACPIFRRRRRAYYAPCLATTNGLCAACRLRIAFPFAKVFYARRFTKKGFSLSFHHPAPPRFRLHDR